MNERAQIGDPYELALAFWRHLGMSDKCRLIDDMLVELGPMAPIPQSEDIRTDAVWWIESVPDKVRRTYMVELFCALPPDRQGQFIAWAEQNRKVG